MPPIPSHPRDLARWAWDPARRPVALTALGALVWVVLWLDWSGFYLLPPWLSLAGFTAALYPCYYWLRKAWTGPRLRLNLIGTAAFLPVWQWCVSGSRVMHWHQLASFFAKAGLVAAFAIGLVWAVWYVERESRALLMQHAYAGAIRRRIWNPFDLLACYYRSRSRKLEQSLWTFVLYTLAFVLAMFLLSRMTGCREIYEMPAGGGEPQKLRTVVKIEKIIKKKLVVNPYSAVIFNPPPIDDVKLQLLEVTKHQYKVGYGKDDGAGFAKGTPQGKVRFIRLEYGGGDWDQDMMANSDLNMLLEYGIRTGHRVAEKTETRKIAQLANFPADKSPPFVYMTGQRGIALSDREIEVLREYLTDKHGLLFADNGGSGGWHGQFFDVMRRVLPKVRPVPVPLDHPIHRIPYEIPFLPYVAPHGGKEAYGWVLNGRLAAYYHPGDIGDAWACTRRGQAPDLGERLQLGTNVIFYAHVEYAKALEAEAAGGEK
ncbi:MAG: DUF4159 domain-containing protein [Verrucomicrobiales bacterium]